MIDPIALTQSLIQCKSLTPRQDGALDLVQRYLTPLGFNCVRLPFGQDEAMVDNLYARLGESSPNFCFAGHIDVVPPGDLSQWSSDPFLGEIKQGNLYGRGAVDMKGGVAAFLAAIGRFTPEHSVNGSISVLLTSDEEGKALNGTRKVLQWLKHQAQTIDACLLAEPTNPSRLGQAIKIGRRGSLSASLAVFGSQGHSAYPDSFDNPIPRLIQCLSLLTHSPLDQGTSEFEPSSLTVTSLETDTLVSNMTPSQAKARLNIRFNPLQSGQSLTAWLHSQIGSVTERYDLKATVSNEAFLTEDTPLRQIVSSVIEDRFGSPPLLSTQGGTSDGRFLKDYCPVVEFGLVGKTMHQVDEHVALDDLERLTQVYLDILKRYFSA